MKSIREIMSKIMSSERDVTNSLEHARAAKLHRDNTNRNAEAAIASRSNAHREAEAAEARHRAELEIDKLIQKKQELLAEIKYSKLPRVPSSIMSKKLNKLVDDREDELRRDNVRDKYKEIEKINTLIERLKNNYNILGRGKRKYKLSKKKKRIQQQKRTKSKTHTRKRYKTRKNKKRR